MDFKERTSGSSLDLLAFMAYPSPALFNSVCFSRPQSNGTTIDNTAHYYMECSNKGICDRSAATCACFVGYEGTSCQRASCPNDCSGHGVCKTNRELASDDYGNVYELWDADIVSSDAFSM